MLQVRVGQKIKSEVQLATEDFVLVLLKGHASGQFAYLPAKRVCAFCLSLMWIIFATVLNVKIQCFLWREKFHLVELNVLIQISSKQPKS